jgi:hypothetical protein
MRRDGSSDLVSTIAVITFGERCFGDAIRGLRAD